MKVYTGVDGERGAEGTQVGDEQKKNGNCSFHFCLDNTLATPAVSLYFSGQNLIRLQAPLPDWWGSVLRTVFCSSWYF